MHTTVSGHDSVRAKCSLDKYNQRVDKDAVSKAMSEMGRKGGKIGGRRRVETTTPQQRRRWAKMASIAAAAKMTPEQRQERARKAGLAAARARKAKEGVAVALANPKARKKGT